MGSVLGVESDPGDPGDGLLARESAGSRLEVDDQRPSVPTKSFKFSGQLGSGQEEAVAGKTVLACALFERHMQSRATSTSGVVGAIGPSFRRSPHYQKFSLSTSVFRVFLRTHRPLTSTFGGFCVYGDRGTYSAFAGWARPCTPMQLPYSKWLRLDLYLGGSRRLVP
jgi:hypothetical protein